jgi:hypothetical protein
MTESDVLAGIRSVRDELARRYGDARALSEALAEQSRAAGRVVVRFPPRQPQPPRAAIARPPISHIAGHPEASAEPVAEGTTALPES